MGLAMRDAPSHLVIGMGKTGQACTAWLLQQGQRVAVLDTRLSPPDLSNFTQRFPGVPYYLGGWRHAVLSQAPQIIVSPGVADTQGYLAYCRDRGQCVMSDIGFFAQYVGSAAGGHIPVVGITGSNGKSTVTTLVGEMAKVAGMQAWLGGNLGTPAMALLDRAHRRGRWPDYYVLELSSFQLEWVPHFGAHTAAILNLSEDHLDRHGTLAAYVAAKQRIYVGAKRCLYHRQQPLTDPGNQSRSPWGSFGLDVPFSADQAAQWQWGVGQDDAGQSAVFCGRQPRIAIRHLPHAGHAYLSNVLAACSIGQSMGIAWAAMRRAIFAFKGLAHRCQQLHFSPCSPIAWYNDSKGTNVGATCSAIRDVRATLSPRQRLILLLGGVAKQADFSPIAAQLCGQTACVLVFGRDAAHIHMAMQRARITVHKETGDLTAVIQSVWERVQPGDTVLFSPACASFDQFKNYEERGNKFISIVSQAMRQRGYVYCPHEAV